MTRIKSFQDLLAWQKARALVKAIYRVTSLFPKQEQYGLVLQMRRAAVSVPSNIAEGYGRGSTGDYVRFLQTARGSLCEVQTQLILAEDLSYASAQQLAAANELLEECSRLLQGLITRLKEPGGARAARPRHADKRPDARAR